MPRIRIQMPDQFQFSTTIPIRITDLNYGNHVGNDTLLSLLQESRMQYLQSFGYSEMELEGVGLIMSDVSIEFKSELFYGDTLIAFLTIQNFTRVGFDIYYKLVKESSESIVALAKTGMVCYHYGWKKVVSVPEKVKNKLIG